MLLHIFVLDMYHLVFLMSTFLGQDYDAVAYFVLDLYNIVFFLVSQLLGQNCDVVAYFCPDSWIPYSLFSQIKVTLVTQSKLDIQR